MRNSKSLTRRRALAAALSLTVLSAAPANGQASLLPGDCKPEDECLCLLGSDAERIAKDMVALDRCLVREKEQALALESVKAQAQTATEKPWWENGEVVVGGVVVGFTFGGLLGYLLAK